MRPEVPTVSLRTRVADRCRRRAAEAATPKLTEIGGSGRLARPRAIGSPTVGSVRIGATLRSEALQSPLFGSTPRQRPLWPNLARRGLLCRSLLTLAALDARDAGWIPTERVHPVLRVLVLSTASLLAAGILVIEFEGLVPLLGSLFGGLVLSGTLAICALGTLWIWASLCQTAIRVSPSGIEVRRRFMADRLLSTESLVLRAFPPAGFGLVYVPNTVRFNLSPNQFAAASRVIPVQARKGRTGARHGH